MIIPEFISQFIVRSPLQALLVILFLVVTIIHIFNHLLALLFKFIRKKSKTKNQQEKTHNNFITSPADPIHDVSDPLLFVNKKVKLETYN